MARKCWAANCCRTVWYTVPVTLGTAVRSTDEWEAVDVLNVATNTSSLCHHVMHVRQLKQAFDLTAEY